MNETVYHDENGKRISAWEFEKLYGESAVDEITKLKERIAFLEGTLAGYREILFGDGDA